MKIFWSNFAKTKLKEVYQYYSEKASKRIAIKLKIKILDSTKQLQNHPESGNIDESIKLINKKYRYLVESNYKIIYKIDGENIMIIDIFDSRQDPSKVHE